MEQFFTKDYTGAPFILFNAPHLISLGIVILFNLSFIFLRRIQSEKFRKIMRYSMAAPSLTVETAWHAWNYFTGQWTLQTMLPLHLCSMFVFLNAIMMFTRSYRIYELAYFLAIGGAMQALLTPDAGIYGFPHFRAFQCQISHGLIISEVVYMTVVEGFRPTWGSLKRVFIYGNLYLLFVSGVNWLLGSNYMFVAHKPETASLIDMLGPWPWYVLGIEAIGAVVFLLLYLPFAISDMRKAQPVTA